MESSRTLPEDSFVSGFDLIQFNEAELRRLQQENLLPWENLVALFGNNDYSPRGVYEQVFGPQPVHYLPPSRQHDDAHVPSMEVSAFSSSSYASSSANLSADDPCIAFPKNTSAQMAALPSSSAQILSALHVTSPDLRAAATSKAEVEVEGHGLLLDPHSWLPGLGLATISNDPFDSLKRTFTDVLLDVDMEMAPPPSDDVPSSSLSLRRRSW